MEFTSSLLHQSPYFKRLPTLESMTYLGATKDHLQNFKGYAQEIGETIFTLLQAIGKEENQTWKSCREMLGFALKLASQGMKGFFGYELLSADLCEGIENFNTQAFARLLINHSQKMQPGETRLIQYGTFWGLLTKRIPEDWGKIEFQSHVETYDKSPAQIDLLLKKMAKNCAAVEPTHTGQRIIAIYNLGSHPLIDPQDEEQTERLEKFRRSFCSETNKSTLTAYLLDRHTTTLLQQ